MIINLTKKIFYDGKEYEELNMDLDGLRCQDLLVAENSARVIDKDKFQLWGTRHIMQILALACHVPISIIYELSAKDFMRMQSAVINFFSDIISPASQEDSSVVPF